MHPPVGASRKVVLRKSLPSCRHAMDWRQTPEPGHEAIVRSLSGADEMTSRMGELRTRPSALTNGEGVLHRFAPVGSPVTEIGLGNVSGSVRFTHQPREMLAFERGRGQWPHTERIANGEELSHFAVEFARESVNGYPASGQNDRINVGDH